MDKANLDVIDFIINVLRDHEKALDGIVERLDKALDSVAKRLERSMDRTMPDELTYSQALKTMRAHILALSQIEGSTVAGGTEKSRRVAIQKFVHALNGRRLIPNDWMDALIRVGIDSLSET